MKDRGQDDCIQTERDLFDWMGEAEKRAWLEKLNALSDDELREVLSIPSPPYVLANGHVLRVLKGGA